MTAIEFNGQLINLKPSLLKFAYRLTMKKEDAKDLVQDTFLKVLMKQDKYLDQAKFKSWTFTIMKNVFIDNYRHSNNQIFNRDEINESFFVNQTEPCSTDDPHSVLSTKEIAHNIDQLKEPLRIPFKMFINGYKYREIADELNINIGTVKKRIFLSRKRLENLLRA
jgi:RNA polymerase sigma factor (sigma-70 family)